MIELDSVIAGYHIDSVCEKAVAKATEANDSVRFEFNGTEVICQPGEIASEVSARWARDFEAAAKAYRESPEYKEAQAKREREHQEMLARHLSEPAKSEAEMRAADVPWPYTIEQLTEYVNSLVDREHDYGTCVYAMSMAATAAMRYVAHKLGATGFQASCADLDILRRTRRIEGPFMLLKGEDALYPQYDLPERLREAMVEWKPWLKEQATKRLSENGAAHPDVLKHWENLAKEKAA